MSKSTIKILVGLAAVLTLSSCAITYTYDGNKYTSKDDFFQAVEANNSNAVASITPLEKPLTTKKLIFGIPSESTLHAENVRRFTALQGTQPIGNAKEIVDNLTRANYKGVKAFFEAAQKKNIYSSVQFVDLDSMNGSVAPSSNADVIYYVEPRQGSDQWYYASAKHGKQIFSYDRSGVGASGKVSGFNDALQAQAIRE